MIHVCRGARRAAQHPPEHLDTALYADPIWWAPFTLIGKAD